MLPLIPPLEMPPGSPHYCVRRFKADLTSSSCRQNARRDSKDKCHLNDEDKMTNKVCTPSPSGEEKSTGFSRKKSPTTGSIPASTTGCLTCGMAMPLPIPVVPACSRDSSISFKGGFWTWSGKGKRSNDFP